jgi:hypothetical protein
MPSRRQHSLSRTASASRIAADPRAEENMIDRHKRARFPVIAAAGMLAGLAWAGPALAQVNRPDGPIACRDFARNGYGDWTVVRPTTISPRGARMHFVAGQTFMPSEMVNGVEVTAVLDRNCGNM